MDEGLTKSIGVSNASLPQVEEILAAAKHKPVVNQVSGQAILAVHLVRHVINLAVVVYAMIMRHALLALSDQQRLVPGSS